jgi:hypothetical protein
MQRSQSSYHYHHQDHYHNQFDHQTHTHHNHHFHPATSHYNHSAHTHLNDKVHLPNLNPPEKMFWTTQSTIEETFCAYTDISPPSARRDEERRASSSIDSECEKDVASLRTWAREERGSGYQAGSGAGRKSRQSLPGPAGSGAGVGGRSGKQEGVAIHGKSDMKTHSAGVPGKTRVGHSFSVGAPAMDSGVGIGGGFEKKEKAKR